MTDQHTRDYVCAFCNYVSFMCGQKCRIADAGALYKCSNMLAVATYAPLLNMIHYMMKRFLPIFFSTSMNGNREIPASEALYILSWIILQH